MRTQCSMIRRNPARQATFLFISLFMFAALTLSGFVRTAHAQIACTDTVVANVVVLDTLMVHNRLGAQNPNWFIYALRRDVVAAVDVQNAIVDGNDGIADTAAAVGTDDQQLVPMGEPVAPGQIIVGPGPNGELDTVPGGDDVVQGIGQDEGGVVANTSLSQIPDGDLGALLGGVVMRADKRPRPLVLRVPQGECLRINFTNLLTAQANPFNAAQDDLLINDQVKTRFAGVHVAGLELVNSIDDDASLVGQNTSSLVGPGGTATYRTRTW